MDWNFATTLIGSQPYTSAEEALAKVLDGRVSCPSWPQLPMRGYTESMYVQTGCSLPGLKIIKDKAVVDLEDYDPTDVYTAIVSDDIDYFKYPMEIFTGFYKMIEHDVSGFKAIKGQITGPISEGLQIVDTTGRPVIYDETYCEIVRKIINMSAKWQAKQLSMRNDNVIIFFDEPSLSLLGSPFVSISDEQARDWINDSLNEVDCYRAIHCCGNTNWALLLSTNIDILSIDAYRYGENLVMYPDELSEFLGKGGNIAWGIIPNTDEQIVNETVWSLADRMDAILKRLEEKGIDRKLAARHSIITPQCGLGSLDAKHVDDVLDLMQGVSTEMKGRYGFK
ncbi:MAG: hypothetical protein WCR24_02325 [Candidatus Methanomethylophilaceae archaeon]